MPRREEPPLEFPRESFWGRFRGPHSSPFGSGTGRYDSGTGVPTIRKCGKYERPPFPPLYLDGSCWEAAVKRVDSARTIRERKKRARILDRLRTNIECMREVSKADIPQLLTVAEVAKLLKVSHQYVRRELIMKDKIKAIQLTASGRFRIFPDSVREFMGLPPAVKPTVVVDLEKRIRADYRALGVKVPESQLEFAGRGRRRSKRVRRKARDDQVAVDKTVR